MATIAQFQQKILPLTRFQTLEIFLFVEIKRFENLFVNAQKKQLREGESFKGNIFGTYSPATEEIARFENTLQPKIAGEPYNFEYYGGFLKGIYLATDGKTAEFWSSDSKTPLLVSKYDDLFGLKDEATIEIIRRVILPAFLIEIRKFIGI